MSLEECEQLDALFKEKEALREKMSKLKESVKCPDAENITSLMLRIAADAERSFLTQLTSMLKSRLKKHIMAKEEDTVTETVKEAAENAKEAVKEAAESAKDAVKDAGEDIKDAAHYAKEEIEDAAEDVKKSVKKVITIKAKKPSDNQ